MIFETFGWRSQTVANLSPNTSRPQPTLFPTYSRLWLEGVRQCWVVCDSNLQADPRVSKIEYQIGQAVSNWPEKDHGRPKGAVATKKRSCGVAAECATRNLDVPGSSPDMPPILCNCWHIMAVFAGQPLFPNAKVNISGSGVPLGAAEVANFSPDLL
ncbi:hypothetical protein Bbelb_080410 [Branchiostoma belcheri]|nr:hypothetical protein Bbelb_080410 [Branchiostoma belcheri]